MQVTDGQNVQGEKYMNNSKRIVVGTITALALLFAVTFAVVMMQIDRSVTALATPRVSVALPADTNGSNAHFAVEYTKKGVRITIAPKHDLTNEFLSQWFVGEMHDPNYDNSLVYEWYIGEQANPETIIGFHNVSVDVQAKKGEAVSQTVTLNLIIEVTDVQDGFAAPELDADSDVAFEIIE